MDIPPPWLDQKLTREEKVEAFLKFAPPEVGALFWSVYLPSTEGYVPGNAEERHVLSSGVPPTTLTPFLEARSSFRPHATSKQSLFLQGSLEERIFKAQTSPPTLEEANELAGGSLWCLFSCYANVLFAYTMPGWDNPPLVAGWIIRNNQDGWDDQGVSLVNYIISNSDFSDRLEDNEGGAQTDINVVVNTRNSCLVPGPNIPGVNWALIPDDSGSVTPFTSDFILIDIRATFSLLRHRLTIVSPEQGLQLARERTLASFGAVCNYLRTMSPDLLALRLYLIVNAALFDQDIAGTWISLLWEDDKLLNEALMAKIQKECDELISIIEKSIEEMK